ncbi:hypothetical protein [Mangrovibacterium lignilyticum]|uniref:hypothetical protein n=1 Tax=Mangrovibacterium lignilyticum TaxID=2668052 RepID=UPI0013D6AF87|nr:hypothetical protein [Mangrovibacterium lignilyticum]
MYLKRILLSLSTIIVVFLLFAQQDEIHFIVDGRLTSDDGKSDGATITISRDGQNQEVITPPRTGKFYFELEYNHEYRLLFKREGFFQKIIIISTFVPTEVLEKNNKFPPMSFVLNLFEETNIIDQSFTIKPVARVFYNSNIDNFDSEIYLSDAQLREQILAAEAAKDALASESRSIGRADEMEQAALEKQYDKTIAEADALYHKKSYEAAVGRFRDALMLFSDRSYPKDRIAEIQDLLAALQLAEEAEQNYLAAIKAGDEQFTATQYNGAITSYQKALEYKAKDKYATDRISESEKLMKEQLGNMQYNELVARADEAFNGQVYNEAKGLYQQAVDMRPRDSQYPRDQIKKIDLEIARLAKLKDLEEQYAVAMSQGNASFDAAAYPAALTSFKSALSLKPGDEAAQSRIADTEAAMQLLADTRKYEELIAKADEWFDKEELPTSKGFYQQALEVKPTEQHPKDRIAEIDRRMQFNQQFEELLAEANNRFAQKEYSQAKSKYQQVLTLKADHELSKSRIAEIDQILAQQDLDAQYASAIASADQAFNTQQYVVAKGNYQQALELKPQEKYPQDQLLKIDAELKKLADQAALEEQYQAFMQQGNTAFDAKNYPSAITAYQGALGVKANDAAATARLAESRELLAQIETKSQYDQFIASADDAFHAEELQNAKGLYTEALKLIPTETYPRDQIKLIDERLKLAADFDQLMARADDSFDRKQYTAAKPLYQEALTLIPTNERAQNRIAEIDRILALQDLEKQYSDLLAIADQAFAAKQYEPAKNNYQQASDLKPEEVYPKEQIQKIDQELARLAQLNADYDEAIREGDRLLAANSFDPAIGQYQQALKLKPAETYPAEQIARARQLQADFLKTAQLERSYKAYIAKADSLFELTSYRPSRENYADASRLKPAEQYPRDKMAEIDAILAELQHQQEVLAEHNRAYAAAIERGDGAFKTKDFETAIDAYTEAHLLKEEEEYPVKQLAEIERLKAAALEQAYQAAIAKADGLYNNNELALAKPEYQHALSIKANDAYAISQIALIDQKLQDAALAEAERQKLEAAYAAKIAAADQAFNAENYTGAKPLYQEAQNLKVNEKYPADQIVIIDGILLQLAQQAELDAQYNQAMTSAKSSFEQDLLDDALTYYKQAAGLKPQEPEPPQRISEIEQLQAQRAEEARLAAEAEALRLATEKAAREKYDAAIALGDASFAKKEYDKAYTAYKDALTVFPDEQYPKDKMAEIDNILTQLAQAELARQQKAREDSIAGANLVAYNQKIKEAEDFIDQQKLENAVGSYREAITILPEKEPVVQPKIKELEQLIAQIAKLDADYQAAIQKADEQFNSETWTGAKTNYQLALTFKPQESYPKEQIEIIDLKLKEIELEAERAKAAEKTNAAYNEAIKIADENFNKKDYTVAQFYYQKALGIQPQNPYPQQRLDEISKLIDQSLAADQIKAYNDAISKADTEFDRKGYTLARFYYNKALEIKSWEQYPKDRIKEIGKLTNTLLSQREEQDYLNWISTADEAFVNKDFAVARSYYRRALALKKDEPYPSIKLAEVQKEVEKIQDQQSEKEYNDAVTEADKAFENKNYSIARFYYNKALGLRPNETYPKNQLQLIKEAIGGN